MSQEQRAIDAGRVQRLYIAEAGGPSAQLPTSTASCASAGREDIAIAEAVFRARLKR